jgi:hypothetical protein
MCPPTFASDAIDRMLNAVTDALIGVESRTPGGEVLSSMCDKGPDVRISIADRRHGKGL